MKTNKTLKKIVLTTAVLGTLNSLSFAQLPFTLPDVMNPQGLQEALFGQPVGTDKNGQPIYKDTMQIPSNEEGYVYAMGVGPIERISVPSVPKIQQQSQTVWRAGLGYSCGNFNPFANVQQSINTMVNKFKKMPQAYISGAQQSVAALPAYIMNQMNPTLYNTITKSMDDAFALFEVNFKSCRQLEQEMSNDSGTYFDFINKSKLQKQLSEIAKAAVGGSTPVDEVMDEVHKADGSEGVVGIGGKNYGGENQEPLNMTKQMIVAGYNMLIDRKNKTDESAPSYNPNNRPPVVNAFPSPKDAYDLVEKLYGSKNTRFSSDNKTVPVESKAGVGFRFAHAAHRAVLHSHLNDLVNKKISVQQFYELTKIPVIPQEVEDMRKMTSYTQSNALFVKAFIESKKDMQQRLRFLRDMVSGGMKEPDLQQSVIKSDMEQEKMDLLMQIERDLHELTNLVNEG